MSRIALQTRITREQYERIRHHAHRRRITIAAWMREQAMYGIECDDEAENEERAPTAPPSPSGALAGAEEMTPKDTQNTQRAGTPRTPDRGET